MQDKYLRNRPFLVIQLIKTPGKNAKTSVKGWGFNDSNWNNLENPKIVDRINDKQMNESNIIIDIANSKLLKNNAFMDNDESEIVVHYLKKYEKNILEVMNQYGAFLQAQSAAKAPVVEQPEPLSFKASAQ